MTDGGVSCCLRGRTSSRRQGTVSKVHPLVVLGALALPGAPVLPGSRGVLLPGIHLPDVPWPLAGRAAPCLARPAPQLLVVDLLLPPAAGGYLRLSGLAAGSASRHWRSLRVTRALGALTLLRWMVAPHLAFGTLAPPG